MLLNTLNDNDLVVIYQNGNEQALEELLHRHKRKIFAYIKMQIKDKALAEDFFQDTFIKVINTLKTGNYNEEGKFLPWVMRIAHNLIIDFFRKQKKMQTLSGGNEYDIFETLNLTEINVQDKLMISQIHSDLRNLIKFLPDEQREIVILRMYADKSFKEISEEKNISINTCLGRMRYAILNLRKLVKENNVILEVA
jgi:RNA polymerase sigma-70 factor (ECF subfamily)